MAVFQTLASSLHDASEVDLKGVAGITVSSRICLDPFTAKSARV